MLKEEEEAPPKRSSKVTVTLHEILEDTDWIRPGGSGSFDDDYEDMFNQDPGQN